MSVKRRPLDPHERPSSYIKDIYKAYQKLSRNELDKAPDILDFNHTDDAYQNHAVINKCEISKATVEAACECVSTTEESSLCNQSVQVYEARDIPGKWVTTALCRQTIDFYQACKW